MKKLFLFFLLVLISLSSVIAIDEETTYQSPIKLFLFSIFNPLPPLSAISPPQFYECADSNNPSYVGDHKFPTNGERSIKHTSSSNPMALQLIDMTLGTKEYGKIATNIVGCNQPINPIGSCLVQQGESIRAINLISDHAYAWHGWLCEKQEELINYYCLENNKCKDKFIAVGVSVPSNCWKKDSGICESKICSDTTWNPSTSTICKGEKFTQTSNCGNKRESTGTKDCATPLITPPKIEGCKEGEVCCKFRTYLWVDYAYGCKPTDECVEVLGLVYIETDKDIINVKCGGDIPPPIEEVKFSELKKITLETSNIRDTTSTALFDSVCRRKDECINLKSEEKDVVCRPIATLREDGVISEIQEESFFEISKNAISGATVGSIVGGVACTAFAITGSAVFSPAFFATLVPCMGLFTAGGTVGAVGVGIIFEDSDPLVKALKGKDSSEVGLCIYKDKPIGNGNGEDKFNVCDLTDWMSSIIGEENIKSCGARLVILIAVFLFAFALFSKTK